MASEAEDVATGATIAFVALHALPFLGGSFLVTLRYFEIIDWPWIAVLSAWWLPYAFVFTCILAFASFLLAVGIVCFLWTVAIAAWHRMRPKSTANPVPTSAETES